MHIGATQFLGTDHFTGGGLNQRWAAEKDCALIFDNHRFIGHCRHVSTAGGTTAHDAGNLRNVLRGHARLVVEDAAEMFPVRKHSVLIR